MYCTYLFIKHINVELIEIEQQVWTQIVYKKTSK